MARLTQGQIRHLKDRITNKIKATQAGTGEGTEIKRLMDKKNALSRKDTAIAITSMNASEVKKLVLVYLKAGSYNPNFATRIRATKKYKQGVGAQLTALEAEIGVATQAAFDASKDLVAAGEKLIDQAVFAGSSDEVMEAIDKFMKL